MCRNLQKFFKNIEKYIKTKHFTIGEEANEYYHLSRDWYNNDEYTYVCMLFLSLVLSFFICMIYVLQHTNIDKVCMISQIHEKKYNPKHTSRTN